MSKITDIVSALAEPVVKEAGCRLWDVEYVKEAGSWYLRVFIDKEGGVSINDCENISRALDPILDAHDPIPDSYIFEVGSAGSNRVLKRQSDFDEFSGYDIDVKLYSPLNGSKAFTGKLISRNDEQLTVDVNGNQISLDNKNISGVRLHAEYEI